MNRSRIASRILFSGCLALALALPGASWAGQPFDELLAQIAILNGKLDALQEAVDNLSGNGGAVNLRGVTQNWDKNLPVAERFTVLTEFNDEAVRDNNTGLVWDRAPASTTFVTWNNARLNVCAGKVVGGQKGFRLPSMPELTSLLDPSVASPGPKIMPNHPFLNIQSVVYWSATTDADSPSTAWGVSFGTGGVDGHDKLLNQNAAWCVRGGMNADKY